MGAEVEVERFLGHLVEEILVSIVRSAARGSLSPELEKLGSLLFLAESLGETVREGRLEPLSLLKLRTSGKMYLYGFSEELGLRGDHVVVKAG